MNSKTFTRKIESRRHFLGGSGARIVMAPDEAGLIRLLKEERGEAETKIRRAGSRVRISAARRQSAAQVRSLRPGSLIVRRLFKLLSYFLHPGSPSRTPTPRPYPGVKTNPAAPIADRNFSTVLSRESRPASNQLTVLAPTLAAGARSAALQSRAARTMRD